MFIDRNTINNLNKGEIKWVFSRDRIRNGRGYIFLVWAIILHNVIDFVTNKQVTSLNFYYHVIQINIKKITIAHLQKN